ncbi:MAG: hypothetical protein HY905_18300 [Deltaproteobacteria bacterium]|nr:hypothetical protein [Deltaproteobacteria bacterium]
MKTRRMIGLLAAATVACLVVGVAGTGGNARATTDAKRYPASACVAVWNQHVDEDIDSQYGYSEEGFLENYSAENADGSGGVDLKIQCAATRECTNTASDGNWFGMRDDNDAKNGKCRMEVWTPTGSYYWGSFYSTSGASTTPQRVDLVAPTNSPSYNFQSLYCELPPQDYNHWRNVLTGYQITDDGC